MWRFADVDQPHGHFVFLRKSFTFHDIADSATWLALALKGLFLAFTGTITGTDEQLVNEKVESGPYQTASEVVRAALQLSS